MCNVQQKKIDVFYSGRKSFCIVFLCASFHKDIFMSLSNWAWPQSLSILFQPIGILDDNIFLYHEIPQILALVNAYNWITDSYSALYSRSHFDFLTQSYLLSQCLDHRMKSLGSLARKKIFFLISNYFPWNLLLMKIGNIVRQLVYFPRIEKVHHQILATIDMLMVNFQH